MRLCRAWLSSENHVCSGEFCCADIGIKSYPLIVVQNSSLAGFVLRDVFASFSIFLEDDAFSGIFKVGNSFADLASTSAVRMLVEKC